MSKKTKTIEKNTPKSVSKSATNEVKGSLTSAKSEEELVVENFAAVSNLVASLTETLEILVQKTENMAYHIIATEQIVAELVSANGLDLAKVNARIRAIIASGTDNLCDPSKAIDIAASLASPLPRR